ncbi:OLC1v1025194C1 [Oldenlandia corymbosa var. corymbosa]|uniref:OLC1v1025194C1 n=1 Tax=Oldenlandia corymbosa var. corymbosa TaxID=529605 RepID=A0AAV1C6Z9_OLDCO|nr:OLC1v1025194C1 [Oldenlandia corymbosa var. corymbosa]
MESSIALRASSDNPPCFDVRDASPVDRISNLPEPIICHILSLMPTYSAVATSTLSKSWRYLWTKANAVQFDAWSCSFDDDIYFEDVVNKVLTQLKSKQLDLFHLFWYNDDIDPATTSKWISEAIARNVKVLYINDEFPTDEPIQLPRSLFTCKTLESLSLGGDFLFEVPGTVHLPKLGVLELNYVFYESDKAFHEFISSCPMLYSLSICRRKINDGLIVCAISSCSLRVLELDFHDDDDPLCQQHLKIEAPALERLIMRDEFSVMFSLEGLSSLREAKLDLYDWDCDSDACNLVVKQVQAMNCAKLLTLTGRTLFALTHATTRLSAKFERLTRLYLDCEGYNGCKWSFPNDLLDCSMKLEFLHITKWCYRINGAQDEICWRKPSKVPECLSNSLAQVSFSGFEGLSDELKLIKYILKHGVVLKCVNLDSRDAPDDFKKKISVFPRTSQSCQVKFS